MCKACSCCRSFRVCEAASSIVAEINLPVAPYSSTSANLSLEKLHSVVDSLRSSKQDAGEAVSRLEMLPVMLQSSPLDYSAAKAEAQWLSTLVSSTSLPGEWKSPAFCLQAFGCGAISDGCLSTALTLSAMILRRHLTPFHMDKLHEAALT